MCWLLGQLSACYAVKYAVDWQRELINAFVLDDTTAAPHGGHEEEDEVRRQAVVRRFTVSHGPCLISIPCYLFPPSRMAAVAAAGSCAGRWCSA